MRKLYPMPVDGLFGHPDWIALPAAARGMLMSLCEHFWRTECRPLPKDDDQLFAIARAHRPTWRHHKPMILSVFKTLEPDLAAYHHKRVTGADTLRIAARDGHSEKRARKAAAHIAEASPAPMASPLPALEPNRVERPVSRAKAAKHALKAEAVAAARMMDHAA